MEEKTINRKCAYCKEDPGEKPGNPHLWDGFFDADTREFVCFKCQGKHYEKKWKSENTGKYSEFPVLSKMKMPYEYQGKRKKVKGRKGEREKG